MDDGINIYREIILFAVAKVRHGKHVVQLSSENISRWCQRVKQVWINFLLFLTANIKQYIICQQW